MTIPHIIHQTWKDKNIPYTIYKKRWIQSWKKYHPKWRYKLWTDFDNRRLIATHYPWFLKKYDSYENNISRVDAVRYFILHRYGGVYADLDYECLKNIEPLLLKNTVIFSLKGNSTEYSDHNIHNAFMASCKNAPFWDYLFNKLLQDNTQYKIENIAGPIFLTRTINTYPHKSQIKIYEHKYLCPIDWEHYPKGDVGIDTMPIFDIRRKFPHAYAITYWKHNWDDGTFSKYPIQAIFYFSDKTLHKLSQKLRCIFKDHKVYNQRQIK